MKPLRLLEAITASRSHYGFQTGQFDDYCGYWELLLVTAVTAVTGTKMLRGPERTLEPNNGGTCFYPLVAMHMQSTATYLFWRAIQHQSQGLSAWRNH